MHGTKLKPMIVFKGAKREVAVLRQEFKSKAYIGSSSNARMTTELTNEWVSNVLGSFAFGRRQLAWDSYECHMEDSVVQSLSAKKFDAVIVPGGCTNIFKRLMFCGINHSNPLVQRNMTSGWVRLESTAKQLLEI